MSASAVGAGLNPSFAHRPATYQFATDANVASGLYQELGKADGILYLVACGPPAGDTVLAVPVSKLLSWRVLPSFRSAPRVKLQDAISQPLDLGYRACK